MQKLLADEGTQAGFDRIKVFWAVLFGLAVLTGTVQAQNFIGCDTGKCIYSNVLVTSTSPGSPTLILPSAPNGVQVGCVTIGTTTNNISGSAIMVLYDTNSVSGGGTAIPAGQSASWCYPPRWQGAFYCYVVPAGATAVVNVAMQPLENSHP